MHPGEHAARAPDRPAVILAGSGAVTTYGELDAGANRLAQLLWQRGLRPGDSMAVWMENNATYLEATWAPQRSGLYYTPVSSRLTAGEVGYILEDCEAKALVTSYERRHVAAELQEQLAAIPTRLMVGGVIDGFEPYEEVVGAQPAGPRPELLEGRSMLYSSGTTGRPKGVKRPLGRIALGTQGFDSVLGLGRSLYGFGEDVVFLSPAPLYHTAPLWFTMALHRAGATTVVMEHFDPVAFLAEIERHRVTHAQVVPTHLVRLLKLPERDRTRFDLSSLRLLVHAAAPCPVEVKRAALGWLGPIIHEFYSGSEGSGFCYIGPDDWLAHPGSVGRSLLGGIHILGDDGEELPAGEAGQVWFETPHRFEYHRDPVKTAAVWNDRGWSTLGDIGRVDEDGYLYLTDRASNMIISGGVNIYPREVEDQLVVHPAVADVAVLGTPDPDWGEQVTAFVQPMPGVEAGDALAGELIEFCRTRLSHFKCPRTVRFVDELPRLPTGKLLKRRLV
ncbi:MAG: AMP-binding protein [Acidimicrobiales bacterium]